MSLKEYNLESSLIKLKKEDLLIGVSTIYDSFRSKLEKFDEKLSRELNISEKIFLDRYVGVPLDNQILNDLNSNYTLAGTHIFVLDKHRSLIIRPIKQKETQDYQQYSIYIKDMLDQEEVLLTTNSCLHNLQSIYYLLSEKKLYLL